jgi:predicted CoA-binding protein
MRTDDRTAREVLASTSTWAVVGASDDPWRSSHHVVQLLAERGYDVVPVNPAYDTVAGLRCYPTLADVPRPVDVVDLFRRSEDAGRHVDEAVAIGAKVVWSQLGVFPDEAALERARAAGLTVVVDHCPAQDIPRFFGDAYPSGRESDGELHRHSDLVADRARVAAGRHDADGAGTGT